jgi:hypothetical protein
MPSAQAENNRLQEWEHFRCQYGTLGPHEFHKNAAQDVCDDPVGVRGSATTYVVKRDGMGSLEARLCAFPSPDGLMRVELSILN